VGGGAAHIKVADGSAVVGPAGDGAEEEKLFERKFALKNIALGEAEFALEVEWRKDLAAYDDIFDVGSIFCLLYTSPSPRDLSTSRMPSSA